MNNKNWFEVSREGLRELQQGKPKEFILKELVQNAWDEDGVTFCKVVIQRNGRFAGICVEDDAPEGFKDISHAFTLFAPTYKRKDPTRRGRFNIGEKQVLAICKEAKVMTTKGTIIFNDKGRMRSGLRKGSGSMILTKVRMTADEIELMIDSAENYLPPKEIKFTINDKIVPYKEPLRIIEATLPTEIQHEDRMTTSFRKTEIHIHPKRHSGAYLYEMGLPICKLDCSYSVDVQQKVPLSVDRTKVTQSYLKKIFTLILNEFHEELTRDNVSDTWVREASGNKDASVEAIKSVVDKRFGEKVVVATPGDRHGVDKALSKGFKVVYGSEMSSAEWVNVRRTDVVKSTKELFPVVGVDTKSVKKTKEMDAVERLAQQIATLCFDKTIVVRFLSWESGIEAQYGGGILTFNVQRLGKEFFNEPVSAEVINLIIHELGHEKGLHTESSYHEAITQMAGELIMTALESPDFFWGSEKEVTR